MRSLIVGTGSYSPEKVLTNADLEKIVDTNDQWIVERTGIRERHVAAESEATSDLAYAAAVKALEMAKVAPEDVDLIIVGTVTPDMSFPSTACLVQGRLGNKKAAAFDVSAACAGSLYALAVADRFVSTGMAKNALVIGADTLTRITDWTDRNTCILFGDGAGAMVLQPTDDPRRGILSVHLHADGSYGHILNMPGGGSRNPVSQKVIDERLPFIKMKGSEVYKVAVRALEEVCREALARNGVAASDLAQVIAHQANKRILDSTLHRLGVPEEKCWMNLEKYGNTSSASVPTTLDEANRAGRLRPGDALLMMAIGGGMAWGSALVRW
ncbi:beta-ketoacyl-ACP synthase III [Anaeromyxobacter paludicola]|uniref:Beta-ketoacyl-[acyl-carrier-protein] synthase III n=1 Tax=Anaeromyxobacter paludicola TaxID=2918171 RepID=A0ABN6N4I0_9BACT|nr:beta-ketoacyl-ACP synthase III [Anaeromyxobacter paludicola]BDG06915.1 3-oxoacyl-[acyl-carrier-protein] synthase 3 [Anaeromyxobacter paludicola]